jgi:glycosyltransferase involved in cell wall biosynthesis
MNTSPLISVCIPTFNGAPHLKACLDSVLSQTLADFEVLIVDDCSTDETLAIAAEYAGRDARFRLVKNERNLGLVGNWNRCIELAQGEWIKFVFQDDMLEPECLERMIAARQAGDLFVACARRFEFEPQTPPDVQAFYLDNKQLVDNFYAGKSALSAQAFADLAVERIGANLVGEPTVTLLHKSVFERFGAFNEHLIMSCDLEYWVRVGIHTGIRFVPEDLAVFRVHGQATSATNRRDRQYRMKVLDNLAIWHDAATHPTYAPLRAAAERHVPPIPLKHMMLNKAHVARVIAQHFDKHNESTYGLMGEWRSFVNLYPQLRVGGLGHLYWCARNRSVCKNAQIRIALP